MASRKEMEERLHACDPYEGGVSMADAALERLPRNAPVADPKPSARALEAAGRLGAAPRSVIALALDAFAEEERKRVCQCAHCTGLYLARIRALGTNQGGDRG